MFLSINSIELFNSLCILVESISASCVPYVLSTVHHKLSTQILTEKKTQNERLSMKLFVKTIWTKLIELKLPFFVWPFKSHSSISTFKCFFQQFLSHEWVWVLSIIRTARSRYVLTPYNVVRYSHWIWNYHFLSISFYSVSLVFNTFSKAFAHTIRFYSTSTD